MKKPTPEPPPPPPSKPRLGEVRHDERGRAVWHWAVDTARHAVISTSQLLRKLDVSDLSLEEDHPPRAVARDGESGAKSVPLELAPPDAIGSPRRAGAAAEFNPYQPARPVAPARPARPVRPSQPLRSEDALRVAGQTRRPGSAAPRPSWWRRLLGRG